MAYSSHQCYGLHLSVTAVLHLCRLLFSYEILTPAALSFFVSYAGGAVESLWSIDQYFEFVLVLMLSTGLAFQVCLYLPYCTKAHAYADTAS